MEAKRKCSINTCKRNITAFCGCEPCVQQEENSNKKAYCSEKCQVKDEEHLSLIGFWCGKKNYNKSCPVKKYGCPPREPEPCVAKGEKTKPIITEVHQLKQNDLDDLIDDVRQDEKLLTVCGVDVRLIIRYYKKRFELSAWYGTTRFYHKKINYKTEKKEEDKKLPLCRINDEVEKNQEKEEEETVKEVQEDEEYEGPDNSDSAIRIEIINVPKVSSDIYVPWIYFDGELFVGVTVN